MKKSSIIIIMSLVLLGCGLAPPTYRPLEERLLKVAGISPPFDGVINPDGEIAINFTRPIDEKSVGVRSIAIVDSTNIPEDATEMDKDLSLDSISGDYNIKENGLLVSYRPSGGFEKGGSYGLLIGRDLCAVDGMPFCGGAGCNSYFVSRFYVAKGEADDGEGVDQGQETDPDIDTNTNTDLDSDTEVNEDTDTAADTDIDLGPAYIMINEIYYDAPGTDTNGDLFIELCGEPEKEITGYYLVFINGDDGKSYETISIKEGSRLGNDGLFVIADTSSSEATNVLNADMLENFDPQNGPDSVQLISPDDKPADIVGYGSLSITKAINGYLTFEGEPADKAASGQSISRKNCEDSNNNKTDFAAALISPGSI